MFKKLKLKFPANRGRIVRRSLNFHRSSSTKFPMTAGMAQKTEGIQQLLIAEKKATERVVDARKRKLILSVIIFLRANIEGKLGIDKVSLKRVYI